MLGNDNLDANNGNLDARIGKSNIEFFLKKYYCLQGNIENI